MTATDEIRRLLDKRGVEWFESVTRKGLTWIYRDGKAIRFHPWQPDTLKVSMFDLTPEQAVEATLGTLTEQAAKDSEKDSDGRGECHNTSYRLDESRFHCSECGFGCWVKDVADGRDKVPRHCPNCGRRIKED